MAKRKPRAEQPDLLEPHASLRLRTAIKPIIQQAYPEQSYLPDSQRFTLVTVWAPNRKVLAWVTYQKAKIYSETYRRIQHWTYAHGYGGLVLANLYPVGSGQMEDWRELDDRHGVLSGASKAATTAKAMRVREVVLATGRMHDAVEIELLRRWMAYFGGIWKGAADSWDPSKRDPFQWKCLDVTDDGWPIAVATTGRTRIPIIEMPLKPWSAPAPRPPRRRRALTLNPAADMVAEPTMS